MSFTLHQHKTLTNFHEKNPVPDDNQLEIIAESVGMTINEVNSWFIRCRIRGPEEVWTSLNCDEDEEEQKKKKEEQKKKKQLEAILESKKMLEEQVEKKRKENEELNKIIAQQAAELTESKNLIADKNAEIQNLIKNSAKEDQTESKIISQAAEIQKLETWITNLTTMSHVQSDPVRFLTIEKELARVSSELKAFEEAELKKENERLKDQKELLEAMLQSKKKLEEQVEEANKKIEELSLLLKEKNDKIEAITQKIQEQSANLKEARHLMSCSLSLIDIQKDKIEAQQEEIAKLLKGSETVQ